MNTYNQRFTEIIKLICKSSPPPEMVSEWLLEESDSLQDWIGTSESPWWLQAIGVLEAAHAAADAAVEGEPDKISYKR